MNKLFATVPGEVRPADSLAELAGVINAAHFAGENATRKGLEHFRAAGEALAKAKERCGHGKWLPWLKANVKFSERKAQRYMRLVKSDVTSDLEEQWRVILGNTEGPMPDDAGEEEPRVFKPLVPTYPDRPCSRCRKVHAHWQEQAKCQFPKGVWLNGHDGCFLVVSECGDHQTLSLCETYEDAREVMENWSELGCLNSIGDRCERRHKAVDLRTAV